MEKANSATADVPVETPLVDLSEYHYQPDVPETTHRQRGHFLSCPKKSELKIGESSAFFTYVKSSMLKIDSQGVAPVAENALQHLRNQKKHSTLVEQRDCNSQGNANEEAEENHSQGENHSQVNDFPSSNTNPNSLSLERSCTSLPPMDFSQHPRNESQHYDVLGFHAHTGYPYYIPGEMNEVLPQYNNIPYCHPHVPEMTSFPYYPVRIRLPSGQMPTEQIWSSSGASSSSDGKLGSKVDRREAALLKFRQKRKERCFEKKIRYVNRKRLAENRTRVRGQFVRKMNGLKVDLNGQPPPAYYNDDEEDDNEDYANDDQAGGDCSLEHDALVFR